MILSEEMFAVDEHRVPLTFVQSGRARRYILRFGIDGAARLVVPRGGSIAEARRFAERQRGWIKRQLGYFSSRPVRSREWIVGSEILFRGELTKIETDETGAVNFVRVGVERVKVPENATDLRPAIERHLRALAATELPAKTLAAAAEIGLSVRRVVVRNQRTRWGSCSTTRTISLNWRLVQVSLFVRDYIILHELMHLREMNHSARFWREVAGVCPGYELARRWLREHRGLLRSA